MSRIIYVEEGILPDMTGISSAELVFSGKATGRCREAKECASARGGMEMLKRWISSSSFSVIVLSGFSEVAAEVKESTAFWVSDHLVEPGTPLLIAISSGPWSEGVRCEESGQVEEYLKNIK